MCYSAELTYANPRISRGNYQKINAQERPVKKDIHPDYVACTVTCACGNTFDTRANKPDIHVEICSSCHPFFTGKQKFVDSEGRVQRFQKKFGAMSSTKS